MENDHPIKMYFVGVRISSEKVVSTDFTVAAGDPGGTHRDTPNTEIFLLETRSMGRPSGRRGGRDGPTANANGT
jgi:hypothetical protein